MSATAKATKRLKAAHALKKSGWEYNEPEFKVMDYTTSLIRCLNFYNREIDNDTKQKWVLEYWKTQKKDVKGLEKISSGFFVQAGGLVRIINRGFEISDEHKQYLENRYIFCKNILVNSEKEEKKDASPKVTVQDRIAELASKHVAEFNAALDDFCYKGTDFDPKEYLKVNDIKAPTAKIIATQMKKDLLEFQEAYDGEDKQLNEAYGHFGKRGLKKVIDFLSNCVAACDTMAIISKVARKPRVRKEKPPAVLAAKVKYLREIPELKLRSITPDKIVGAQEVWVYHTKYRKLMQYTALDGYALSIKGTKLLNWDPEKSGAKTIRKPEQVMPQVNDMTKRPLQKLFNDIKSVLAKVNGKFTEETLIVKVF